jgi:hypothetical protein
MLKLRVTVALQAAFALLIRVLSTETQRAMLVAAAEQSSELRLIAPACATLGVSLAALDEAGGLVSVTEHGVLFRHSLVRAAVYHSASAGERRAAHRALADAAAADGDTARRAWHLAAGAFVASGARFITGILLGLTPGVDWSRTREIASEDNARRVFFVGTAVLTDG